MENSLNNYHPNTIKLIRIENEMISLGWNTDFPEYDFCELVAKLSHEIGNIYPSDRAIQIAEQLLENYKRTKRTKKKKREWRIA